MRLIEVYDISQKCKHSTIVYNTESLSGYHVSVNAISDMPNYMTSPNMRSNKSIFICHLQRLPISLQISTNQASDPVSGKINQLSTMMS